MVTKGGSDAGRVSNVKREESRQEGGGGDGGGI